MRSLSGDLYEKFVNDARLNDEFMQNWRDLVCKGERLSEGADLECTGFRQMFFRLIWNQGHGNLFLSDPMDFDEVSQQHAVGK